MSTRRCLLVLLPLLFLVRGAHAQTPYVAFSLTAASRLEDASLPREMNMTTITGMVYDRELHDIIVVGRPGTGNPIAIGDLVVALRARLQFGQFPLVSIDRTADTARTGRQRVRFEPAEVVAQSDFGAKLLAADVRLKKLALGVAEAETSYFAMTVADARKGVDPGTGSALLWFYPAGGDLIEREDVFAIQSIAVGVKAQTTAGVRDVIADRFAAQTTGQFDALADRYPEIAQIRALYALVALATAMEKHPEEATAIANRYIVAPQETPAESDLVTRSERVGDRNLIVSGGIRLAVRNIRLREGDVSALREAVLESRPRPDAVFWDVPIANWMMPEGSSDEVVFPPSGDDPGTHIARRVEVVPELLIYRGALKGNQTLTAPGPGTSGGVTGDARGGVAADVQVHDDDFAKPSGAGDGRKDNNSKKEEAR